MGVWGDWEYWGVRDVELGILGGTGIWECERMGEAGMRGWGHWVGLGWGYGGTGETGSDRDVALWGALGWGTGYWERLGCVTGVPGLYPCPWCPPVPGATPVPLSCPLYLASPRPHPLSLVSPHPCHRVLHTLSLVSLCPCPLSLVTPLSLSPGGPSPLEQGLAALVETFYQYARPPPGGGEPSLDPPAFQRLLRVELGHQLTVSGTMVSPCSLCSHVPSVPMAP